MALLSRDQILTADDLPTEDVPVPEWGGTVRLRSLTGTERDAFEVSVAAGDGQKNLANLRARLVALCIVDDEGKRIFTDADVKKLGMKSGRALDRVFDRARHLSGLSEDDVENLVGNSETAPSGGSTSD